MGDQDLKNKQKFQELIDEISENSQSRPSFSGLDDSGDTTRVGELDSQSITQLTAKVVPVIYIATGHEKGRLVPLKKASKITIGRSNKCDIVLNDNSCSRTHAEIIYNLDDRVYLKDLGSTNGTKINKVQIKEATELADDDHVQLGDNSILRFSLVYEKEAETQMDVYQRATRDGLTGAYNRRQFEDMLNRELAFQKRNNLGLGLIIFDVDHFKSVNDNFGHLAGDEVLRDIGKRVANLIRKEDLFARIGGEEFALITRSKSEDDLLKFAERLRKSMENDPSHFEQTVISFTISLGCCFLGESSNIQNIDTFIQLADEALYRAKESGRNRVCKSDANTANLKKAG